MNEKVQISLKRTMLILEETLEEDLYRDPYYSNVSSSQLLTWVQYTNVLEIQQGLYDT